MRTFLRALFTTAFVAVFAILSACAVLWFTLPDVTILLRQYPAVKPTGAGNPPQISFTTRRPGGWVHLGQISRHARAAILISEDGKFYTHQGVDLEELRNAVRHDLKTLEFKRGASTITQQLVKNVFLTREKNLLRKLRELILTLQVERALRKEKIFETYLNVIEYGPNLYGIGRASWHYFGKHPSELSAKEGSFLAMLLPSPIRYGSSFREKKLTPYAGRIIRMLLRKMVVLGYLTREEADTQWATPLPFEEVMTAEKPTLEESNEGDNAAPIDEPPAEEEVEEEAETPETEVQHDPVHTERRAGSAKI
jgi:monofunctional biosynthetic peptidoglycan transglycosylase